MALHGGFHLAAIHTGTQRGNSAPACIGYQGLWRIKSHGLRGKQRGIKDRGVINLQPRGCINKVGKSVVERVGEPEIGKDWQLGVMVFGVFMYEFVDVADSALLVC